MLSFYTLKCLFRPGDLPRPQPVELVFISSRLYSHPTSNTQHPHHHAQQKQENQNKKGSGKLG